MAKRIVHNFCFCYGISMESHIDQKKIFSREFSRIVSFIGYSRDLYNAVAYLQFGLGGVWGPVELLHTKEKN